MTPELDKKLCDKYPEIFRDRNADMRTTCMCWGIAVGDGWYNLIDNLCAVIQNRYENEKRNYEYAIERSTMVLAASQGNWTLFDAQYGNYSEEYRNNLRRSILTEDITVPKEPVQIVASQVKEKFGTLSFYTNQCEDYVDGAIHMAENMSAHVCEECGAPGRTRGPGWIRTLCEPHAIEHGKYSDVELEEFKKRRDAEIEEFKKRRDAEIE